jgi:hypothetical protein
MKLKWIKISLVFIYLFIFSSKIRSHEVEMSKKDDKHRKEKVAKAIKYLNDMIQDREKNCPYSTQELTSNFSLEFFDTSPATKENLKRFCEKPYRYICEDDKKEQEEKSFDARIKKIIKNFYTKARDKTIQDYKLEGNIDWDHLDDIKKYNEKEEKILNKLLNQENLSAKEVSTLNTLAGKKITSTEDRFLIKQILKDQKLTDKTKKRLKRSLKVNRLDAFIIDDINKNSMKYYNKMSLDYYNKIMKSYLEGPEFENFVQGIKNSLVGKSPDAKTRYFSNELLDRSGVFVSNNTKKIKQDIQKIIDDLKLKKEQGNKFAEEALTNIYGSRKPSETNISRVDSLDPESLQALMVELCGSNVFSGNAFNAQREGPVHIIYLCPGEILANVDPDKIDNPTAQDKQKLFERIIFVTGHELGHSLFHGYKNSGHLEKFKECLADNFAGHMKLRGFEFLNRSKKKIDKHLNEIFSDYMALQTMRDYIMLHDPRKTPGEALSLVKGTYSLLCGSHDDLTHPSAAWRVEVLIRGDAFFSKYFGCNNDDGYFKKPGCNLNGENDVNFRTRH